MLRCLALASIIVLSAGCPKTSSARQPAPPAVDTAALCADLEQLATAAAGNFADHKTETPAQRDGADGVVMSRDVAGAHACVIVRPDPTYADEMVECYLGDEATAADAAKVLATWQPLIAGCPVVASWRLQSSPDGSHSWGQETEDNHLLEIQLDVSAPGDHARPVLRVRRPEI